MTELYYVPDISSDSFALPSDESKHIIKVLHHKTGDTVWVTDGKGNCAKGRIMSIDKQQCYLEIMERAEGIGKRNFVFHLAVSPTKNRDRMEWLVEKAVEIGVEKITFLLCGRSGRTRMDMDRMKRIAIAAMKQSQTSYLPEIELRRFHEFITSENPEEITKFIAWCDGDNSTEELAHTSLSPSYNLLMIGPEGDFSPEEIREARKYGFREISLGKKRLRTETAALYGCCIISGRLS